MPPIFDVESLLLLVDEGDLDGVSALVAAKGEGVVQSKDEWGLTSLHLASATGNEDMVELLLSFNAKVNATTLIGWTPLHDASAEGQAECATILIDRGGTVDAENDDGNTPLHEAAKEGNETVVQVLMDNNANINYVNDHGDSPLHMAVEIGSISSVTMLLECGAFPGCKNVDGISPRALAKNLYGTGTLLEVFDEYKEQSGESLDTSVVAPLDGTSSGGAADEELVFDEDGFPIAPGVSANRGESLYGKEHAQADLDAPEPKGFLQRTRTRHTMRGAKKKQKENQEEAVADLARKMSASALSKELNDVDLTGKRKSSSSSALSLESALQNSHFLALDDASNRGSINVDGRSSSSGSKSSFDRGARAGTTVDQIERRSRKSSNADSVVDAGGEGYEYDSTASPLTQKRLKKEAEKQSKLELKQKAKEEKAAAKKVAARLKEEAKAQKKTAKAAKKAEKLASKAAAKAAKAAAAKEAATAKAAKIAKQAALKEAEAAERAQAAAFAADLSAEGEAAAASIEEMNAEYDAMGELHAAGGGHAFSPGSPMFSLSVDNADADGGGGGGGDGDGDAVPALPTGGMIHGRAASRHQGSLSALKKQQSIRRSIRQSMRLPYVPGMTAAYTPPMPTEEPVVLGVDKSPTGLDISYAMDDAGRLRVVDTAPRGAAEKAGVWIGATILEINGLTVNSLSAAEMALHEAQDETNTTYFKVTPCDDAIPEKHVPTRARRKSQVVRSVDGETYYKTIVVRQTVAALLPFDVADTEDGVVVIHTTLDDVPTGTRILGVMGEKVLDAAQFMHLATADKFTLDVEAVF